MSSILALKPGQFSEVTARSASTLLSDRHRKITASAWGALEPALGIPTFMDAVAVLLVERLNTLGLERKHGATIVRVFAHKWMTACAMIEHNAVPRNARVYFSLLSDGAFKHMRTLIHERAEANEMLERYNPFGDFRLLSVDLRQILQLLATRAEEADMDLSLGAMFYPPDEPGFVAWQRTHQEWADAIVKKEANPERPPERHLLKTERATFEANLVRVRQ